MVSMSLFRAQLAKTLEKTDFPELGSKYVGKVRDCYSKNGQRTIVVTDRISAFDVVHRHHPVQGPGPEPDRSLLVRRHQADGVQSRAFGA